MESTLFLSVFVGYILFLIGLGWFVSRRQKSGEDFLLGGRGLPVFLTLGTTVATMVGTGSSMGAVGFAYADGWAGTLYGLGGALGILLLAWMYAPVRKLRFMTMSEELSYYVGASVFIKNVVAVLIFIASIGWLGAHILGGAIYLSWITDLDHATAKVIIAFGFAIYVIIGGYTAVVWTDTIQAIVLFFGFIMMAVMAVNHVGDWSTLLAAQPPENISLFAIDKIGWLPALSLALVVTVGVLATPSYRQRIYSGKSVSTVRTSFVWAGGLYLLFSFIPAVIGMAAFAINSDFEQAAFAFPFLAMQVLPMGIGMVVLIAGLSATMSSASSDAIAAVTILLRDIVVGFTHRMPEKDKMIGLSRFSLVIIIGLALLLAMLSNNIISYITTMISTVMSGMFVCALLGRFWLRFNWQGALASLLGASITSLVIIFQDAWLAFWGNPVLPSVLVSLLAGSAVTLLTPASRVSRQQALEILTNEREQMEMSDHVDVDVSNVELAH